MLLFTGSTPHNAHAFCLPCCICGLTLAVLFFLSLRPPAFSKHCTGRKALLYCFVTKPSSKFPIVLLRGTQCIGGSNIIIYWWSMGTCSCFVSSYFYMVCPGALISDWHSIRNPKRSFWGLFSWLLTRLFPSLFRSAHPPILVILLHWFIHSGIWRRKKKI